MTVEETNETSAAGREEPVPPVALRAAPPAGRVPMEAVAKRMVSEGYLFDFFQAALLLEKMLGGEKGPGESSEVSAERILFRPHSGLGFPATDVRSIELIEGDPLRARITVTFQGLYGVDSPLPVYFYDSIATEAERTRPLRDFLDIFNHRLYSMFYRSWKKYRPHLHFRSTADDAYSQLALCLAGIGTKEALRDAPLPRMLFASFASELSSRVRCAEGLKNLIHGMFRDTGVAIAENITRWVPIGKRPRIGTKGGGGFLLGVSSTIGEKIRDISGKFRVVLGPLTLAQYTAFLPGGASARILDYLVRLYAADFLDYDVELDLKTEEIPPLRLGGEGNRLGLTTWSGRPDTPLTSRTVSYGTG